MTSTVPAPAGEVAVMEVALFTAKLVAAVAPNFTAVAAVKLVPVMLTTVPPADGPLLGLTLVTVGGGTKVNLSAADVVLVPPVVVTVASTVPAPSAGEVAVIEVVLFTVKLVAAVAPKFTAVTPVKFVPVIVTTVPPAVGPLVGLIPVTVGGEKTETAVSTTDAELYVTLHPYPLGKFSVANVPVTDVPVRIVNAVPA